tara:strand:+ start:3349 stop:3915 length:567 start_codon:yes stop_codon:yes gene_type:complete
MNPFKAILSIGLAMTVTPVFAADSGTPARDYIDAMCTLTGNWTGQFEQYNETGLFRTSRFDAGFQCQPERDVLMETNVFFQDDGTGFSTLKVIFPTNQPSEMQMSYFYGGMEKAYFFKSVSLDYVDSEHWTAARESAGTLQEPDPNHQESRYTHIRNGKELTMIREVKADKTSKEWALSAKLIMEWQP